MATTIIVIGQQNSKPEYMVNFYALSNLHVTQVGREKSMLIQLWLIQLNDQNNIAIITIRVPERIYTANWSRVRTGMAQIYSIATILELTSGISKQFRQTFGCLQCVFYGRMCGIS